MGRIQKNQSLIFTAIGAGILLLEFLLLAFLPGMLPLTEEDILENYIPSWQFYDRRGNLLREAVNSEGNHAFWMELHEMDPFIIEAVIAAEDARFYEHGGIDGRSFLRAIAQNFWAGEMESGASTITMQLARIVKGYKRTIPGKIAQMLFALRLEGNFTKDEILVHYLNRVPMGRGNLGIEAAAKEYFGMSNALLSKGQLSLLAGIIQGPSLYDPNQSPEAALERRHYTLERMVELNYISQNDMDLIHSEPVYVSQLQIRPEAMHFTDFLLTRDLPPGEVHTTLDLELNLAMERLVQNHVQRYSRDGIKHGALVVLDNETLEIRAMIGSPDYWNEDQGSNNGTTMLRQPGSTLKPFTYGLAFEQGWGPGDVIADIPIHYQGHGGRLYEPENITLDYSGPVMLQDALMRSLNIPAVQMANSVGLDNLLQTLRAAGFTSLQDNAEFYGLGLTLGNGEVSLLELASAYTLFPHGGVHYPFRYIEGPKEEGTRVFEEESAFMITEILSNDRLRIRSFGSRNPFLMTFPMSIKTGTSDNWRDNWAVGFTRQFTLAVWVGSFSGEPTNQYSATLGAGPLFHQAASLLDEYYPPENREVWTYPPENITLSRLCPVSGLPPNENCPNSQEVFIRSDREYHQQCEVHRALWVDPRTERAYAEPRQGYELEKRVYEYLPPLYSQWEAMIGREAPPRIEEFHGVEPSVTITSPKDGDIFLIEPGYDRTTQSILLEAQVNHPSDTLSWIINDELHQEIPWPYDSHFLSVKGTFTITARSTQGYEDSITIEIR